MATKSRKENKTIVVPQSLLLSTAVFASLSLASNVNELNRLYSKNANEVANKKT